MKFVIPANLLLAVLLVLTGGCSRNASESPSSEPEPAPCSATEQFRWTFTGTIRNWNQVKDVVSADSYVQLVSPDSRLGKMIDSTGVPRVGIKSDLPKCALRGGSFCCQFDSMNAGSYRLAIQWVGSSTIDITRFYRPSPFLYKEDSVDEEGTVDYSAQRIEIDPASDPSNVEVDLGRLFYPVPE